MMDVDEVLDEDFEEGSDDADNEFQYLNDPSSTQPSSGPPSTPNSCTSSPPINHSDESPVSTFYSQNGNTLVFGSGKPLYGPKRGPGRPRKEYPGARGVTKDARTMFKKYRGLWVMKGVPGRKKFPGKDERQSSMLNNNGPQTSQDGNNFMLMSSKSPTMEYMNNSMESNVSSEITDKSLQFVEEPPYFPEKWPGKICALCNLGERSQLGQGEMLRMEISEEDRELFRTDSPSSDDKDAFSNDMNTNSNTFPQISNRRQKGLNKCKNPVNTSEYVDELDKVGHFESIEMSHLLDNNYYYIHRSCATWSSGVVRDPTGALAKVAYAVSQSLRRKCAYCGHFGASVSCKMACPKFFHYPCVAASGGFQTIQSYISFCKEHLGQVPIICTDDINCRSCCGLGDVSNLVMCSICGDHYHGTCIGLPQLPGVRTGWQCASCHKCQICRVPDTNEGRSLSCEQCHKVYHANCLRPIMSSIPKYGWKCRRCRVCSDCGSRTPGAGASSRWHAHYTVCDSCYQQRNKGFSCPICHRAYRAAAYKEMVKCSLCNKFVHSTCDLEADLAVYHARKESNPDHDYVCPPCKQLIQSGRLNQALARRNSSFDDDLMPSLQESCQGPDDLDSPEVEKSSDFGLGKGKPYAMKVSKKRIGISFGQLTKGRGKLGFGKRSRLSDLGRKRGPKTKMRGIFGVPGLSLQRPIAETNNADDQPGIENRLVLCSAKDKFILTQDICVMCGAIGTDYEGCLISCAQCGQCYHPYCVSVKVTKVILKKGWRCLDCTVCEGCGQKNDEARLILCDECDISYHTYCMDPPLEHVPQGNWKCKWCAVCQKCGRESPGKNCTWKNSYSECGPCASQACCAVCSESYSDGELVIQCAHCERWLHCKCDMIKNEEEAEKCDDDNYHCVLCRPKDLPPLHLMPAKRETPTPKPVEVQFKLEEPADTVACHGLEGSHFIDGVFLSEHGLSSIKSLQMEYIRKKRKQKVSPEINNKEAGILASIESVVAGSGVDALSEDTKVELLDPKEEAEIYKDGMVWERSDGSPPEGFALCTNEQGVVVLRKKRQRNLQKLGIGGFNVRNRTMKKDKDDMEEHGDSTTAGTGSNENTPIDKKKKPIRKRQKNKLAETYPVYLQEAFFGKSLLDTTKANFESDSSDDDAKSNVSDDKIVKLSPEELKMLESVKNANKGNTTPNASSALESGCFTDVKNIMLKSNTSENSLGMGVPSVTSQGGEDDNDTDADTLKDILPQDLLDSDLVNSIINDGDDLVKSSDLGVQFDANVGSRKDDLPDILGPNFNLDSIGINSKDVEEIFQGVIDPEPKQYSNIIKQENPVISLANNQFPKATTPTDIQQYVSTGVMEDVKPPLVMNSFLPVQSPFSNNSDMQNIEPVQVHSTSSTPTQGFNNQNPSSTGSNSSMGFTSNASVPNVWSSNSQSPRQSVDYSASQSEDSVASGAATESCSMKSTEKMRRDEELGEMATKAAVLYANTNHPELKHDFPNWSDRQKQIYKRWRALSNEKKAPFLQQARDNRTALRMRKNQQDQEKIASQQKSLKEQEQERQWKQLQAMRAKEQQLQQFSTQASDQTSPSIMPSNTPPNFMQDQNVSMEKHSPYSSIPGTPRPQFSTDVIQPTVYATHLDTYQPPSMQLNSPIQENIGTVKKQENKQLRDLLQRQESIGGLISNPNTVLNVSVPQGTQQPAGRWNANNENVINARQSPQFSGSTFREPFPVTLQGRNPKVISNNPSGVRMPNSNVDVNSSNQQFNHAKMNINLESQCDNDKKLDAPTHLANMKLQTASAQSNMQVRMKIKESVAKVGSGGGVGTEIPDHVTAELEKLEQDENVAIGEVEGVGDILGGLGEDDDDELLKSLTAEMGADFNILEYADPELDALTGGDNQNLLDKLDFDEGDPELKKSSENRFAAQQRPDASAQGDRQNMAQSAMQSQIINQAPPRYNNAIGQQSNLCAMPPRTTLPPPPPPYPGPPPPYPANTKNVRHQEQPLLLEDLVEQEKREQQQQQLTSSIVAGQLNDKKSFATKAENPHRSATPMLNTWRKNTVEMMQNPNNMMINIDQKKEIGNPPAMNFNFQPAPPQPPENIITEQDRMLQLNYEQWLNNQNVALENQLKYFEDKITKIRKSRKSLNSKQRLVKKSGGELTPHDAKELAKIIAEQPGIQKQLDNAKKQYRQHGLIMQEYKSKHLAKIQMPSPNIPSPAQMTPHSPMLSPSTSSQSSIQMRTSPSPLSAHMLQSARSPIQSPSPLLSHSPGGISQSPVHQSNSNPSPFNTIQASPRIGTPHSQMDENSFSPSAATMSSPSSLPGRHASPAPRITSPQHRINVQQLPTRIVTSPGHSYSTIIPTQSSKFNPPHSHHDRIRVQIGQQQLLHQSQMNIDGQQQQSHHSQQQQQQHIVTSLQMQNFQQQSSDMIQTQRMHFIQQRQIMQRQVSQTIINQAMNKPKNQQNQVSSPSPSHVSPSPSSPLLQCSLQQNPNSNNFVLNSPDQQYNIQQCGDGTNPMVDLKNFSRGNQDGHNTGNNSRGGGLSNLTSGFLPYTGGGTSSKYGKIRLGLFGGSPMWNLSNNITHKINMERAKCSGEKSSMDLDKSGDKDKMLDGSSSMTNNSNQLSKNDEDVVVIDSSPDEKQRIMDYDDYQDKGFVTTEVSLSSVAQNIGDNDDITVIESFTPSELTDIVSSPLETEVAEEYVLFSSDVVDYADSDDSLKPNMIVQSDEISKRSDSSFEKDFDLSKSDSKLDVSDSNLSSDKVVVSNVITKKDQINRSSVSNETSNLTSQDFEVMIDSKGLKDGIVTSKSTSVDIVNSNLTSVNAIPAKFSHIAHIAGSNVMTINRIPFTTVQCGLLSSNLTQTTNSTTLKVTPKKVNDVGTATTKVSFGNTTISVPLLKNMTISSPHILATDKQGKIPTSITLTKSPAILNVRGAKLNPTTIVSLSSLQLKPATNAKIVQATVVGKKLHIPQTTAETLANVKQNLMHRSDSKLSTFTVLQDLPTKIFEDEPTSPETANEHEDSEPAKKSESEIAQNIIVNKIIDNTPKHKDVILASRNEDQKASNNRIDSLTKEEGSIKQESNSNKDPQKLQTRLISIVPQLSPLSQPTEMTTNMANVSQQLRSIMSSIASNQHDQKSQCDNEMKKEATRTSIENKVEKLLQAAQQSQHQQQIQQQQHLQQQQLQQNDEQKDAKSSMPTNELTTIAKPITSSSNKVTFLLTSSSGATTQFQTVVNSVDLQAKKTKVVVPTSVLASRLPSAIVMTSIPSNVSTSTSQSGTDSIISVHNSQEASKKILKSLQAHITSTHLKRSKSTDDGIEREKEVPAQITGTKRYSLEVTPSKTEGTEAAADNSSTSQSQVGQPKTTIQIQTSNADQSFNGCKISNVITQPSRSDDSQNVLLKQLLQNSTGSSNAPSAPQVLATRKVPGLRAPSLGLVSSLEAQLARPVIPPVPATPPSILTASSTHGSMKTNLDAPKKSEANEEPTKKPVQVISRETSFVSKPPVKTSEASTLQEKSLNHQQQQQQHHQHQQQHIQQQQHLQQHQSHQQQQQHQQQHQHQLQHQQQHLQQHQQPHHQQSNYEISNKTPVLSKPENKLINIHRTNSELFESKQQLIKADEEMRKTPSQVDTTIETVKAESIESPSLKRPNSNSMPFSGCGDTPTEELDHIPKEEKSKSTADVDNSIELKKKKKREYQKNRRQMQLLNKDLSFSKKRARKVSKVDGDYDMFTDNLMAQLRQMPPLQVLEPLLSRNYGICPPYGAGDLTKLGNIKEGVPPVDMLQGDYGYATSTNIVDFYNTKPFGPLDMPPEPPNTTIQNGFYDQEFPPIKFETENDDRLDYSTRDWDVDTPESIVTSSSPECTVWEPILPFPGLRVINEDEEDDEPYNRMSPVVPVIAPIPIKLKTGIDLSIDRKIHDNNNKENSLYNEWRNRNAQPTTPAKDPNVTVTLTLTSSAAEDIMSVLRDLANILHIPAPTSYQIVERTTTPPSQKLGLYRTKGKDGKEGDPIDIQTILNGAAKFCRHCDVVILNTIIRAKASEFPLLASNNELLNNSDDLYFCSKSCYKQFKWRPTNIIDDNYNLNSKLNIALDSNRFPVDGYPDLKSIKVEHSVGDVKNARKASAAGFDDNYHKNKIPKLSHDLLNNSSNQLRTADKVKGDSEKPQKVSRYRYFSSNMFAPPVKYKKPSEKEITDMLFRMNITVAPTNKMPDDTRQCIFCNQVGDGVADGPSRLLNFDVDKWVHLNCALWSDGVYETENGALMNLEAALQVSLNQTCTLCHNLGATIKCFKNRCSNVYHLSCAIKDNCTFYKNKTTNCMAHVLKNEKENELTTLSVQRRVYVDRDESRQVAAVMHHSELSNLLRVGSLTFLNVGQLLPHQLQAFHTPNYIYPIGYKIIRFYWSMRNPNKRCRYICSIADVAGRPEFRVIVQEPSEEDIELRDATPKAVWQRILEPLATLRKNHELVQLFPKYVTGEDLFGLTEPAVVRILESLPGIETLTDYRFKYGRNPLLELPLAINPSGAARTEPKQRQAVGWRKPHTQRTGSTNQRIPLAPTTTVAGEVACPYSKQFVHSKSSQYKKMKQEWRNNVFLARSKIQGLGLYAARDLEKHTMVIEYIGEVIRTEVSEIREKQYEARNRGIYMFRLDEDRVVDATLSGGLARYINHSCNPNCVTEIVEVDREYRIIIFAKRRINRGEELSYDYKFDIEDDAHKISCMCGAPNCRKWMN